MTFDPLELARSLGDVDAPSKSMVKRGYHGNGVWADDAQTMVELNERSREVGAARRAARIEAYDNKIVSGLESSAELQVKLTELALKILRECEEDDRSPTRDEMDLIKRGQAAAEAIPNRAIGKASQRVELSGQVDLVGLIAGETQDDVLDASVVDADWNEDDDEQSWDEE